MEGHMLHALKLKYKKREKHSKKQKEKQPY